MSEGGEHPPQAPDAVVGWHAGAVGAGVVVLTVLLSAVAWCGTDAWVSGSVRPTGEPVLRTDVFPELRPERAEERTPSRGDAWGWVDREAQIVHMPIDIAIDLYLRGAFQR